MLVGLSPLTASCSRRFTAEVAAIRSLLSHARGHRPTARRTTRPRRRRSSPSCTRLGRRRDRGGVAAVAALILLRTERSRAPADR